MILSFYGLDFRERIGIEDDALFVGNGWKIVSQKEN